MGRALPPGTHGFDEVSVGDWIVTGSAKVTEGAIDTFADLTGDRFEIHMDNAAAQAKGFPQRVAHGLLVLSLIDGLKNQTPAQFDAIASLGWTWRFSRPVLVDDTVSARLEVTGKRETRDHRRGVLTLEVVARNQDGAIIQQGENQLMVSR